MYDTRNNHLSVAKSDVYFWVSSEMTDIYGTRDNHLSITSTDVYIRFNSEMTDIYDAGDNRSLAGRSDDFFPVSVDTKKMISSTKKHKTKMTDKYDNTTNLKKTY